MLNAKEEWRKAESAAGQAYSTLMQAESEFSRLQQECMRTETDQANSRLLLLKQAYATSVADLFNASDRLANPNPLSAAFCHMTITAKYGGEGGGAGAAGESAAAEEEAPAAMGM